MALTYTPTTELQAVNQMLASIGETPVSDIPASGVSDAASARDKLHETNRQVQGMGLKFNTDYRIEYSPDADGYINIPTNALRVWAWYGNLDYATRNRKLYDRDNQTNIFTTVVYLNITTFLQWSDLPEHVRRYVAVKAGRRFQAEAVGSQILWNFSQVDEGEARSDMMRWELIKHRDSILNSPGVRETLNRRA
jgi:hypothetical protein